MVWVPGGVFRMGSDDHYPEEAPARDVEVDGLWLGRTTVTNAAYAAFVAATGYRTVAERPLDPADFPGAPAENLVPGSMVFVRTPGPVNLRHLSQWWAWTPGASWRHPEGPGSELDGREDHPVVHVAYEDADAYAAWAGLVLPTEAQWERAARGGADGATYTWGDEPEPPHQRQANYWHGDFPWRAEQGYGSTAPVGSFPSNGYGLADMAGNVWEWTTDWYVERRWTDVSPCCQPRDPRGGRREDSFDPAPAAGAGPPQGHQGRLVPVRRHLLPALPAGRPTAAHDRHRHEPRRVPLRRPSCPPRQATMTAGRTETES